MICDKDCFNCKYPDCIATDYSLRKEEFQKYYQKNKERLSEQRKQYYQANKDKWRKKDENPAI